MLAVAARSRACADLFLVEADYRQAMLAPSSTSSPTWPSGIRDGTFAGVKAWRRMHELVAEGVTFEQITADPVRLSR